MVSAPICANRVRNSSASADQGCSIASQGSSHVHGMSLLGHPPYPYPTFFASGKPISKQIAPTDNMWPKSDNAKKYHQCMVKGCRSVANY